MATTYNDLSINDRINLKATLQAWATYAVLDFQKELDAKVYGLRSSKKQGVQRSSLGPRYTFGRGARGTQRSNALRQAWWKQASGQRVVIEFLQYGRYLDMGVGRGTTHTDRVVGRILREGSGEGRPRKAWYSKRKSYEVKRLREILAEQHVRVPLDMIENALTIHLGMTI